MSKREYCQQCKTYHPPHHCCTPAADKPNGNAMPEPHQHTQLVIERDESPTWADPKTDQRNVMKTEELREADKPKTLADVQATWPRGTMVKRKEWADSLAERWTGKGWCCRSGLPGMLGLPRHQEKNADEYVVISMPKNGEP